MYEWNTVYVHVYFCFNFKMDCFNFNINSSGLFADNSVIYLTINSQKLHVVIMGDVVATVFVMCKY